MAYVLKRLYEGYLKLEELKDPRTDKELFTKSPLCLIGVIGLYIYFFKSLGPKLMLSREPYNVKTAMIIYNIIQIIMNFILTICSSIVLSETGFAICSEVDYNLPRDSLLVQAAIVYMYLKIFDAGDTLFFLLRKSYRQISFLHLYHHSAMMFGVWIGVRYNCGGSTAWIVLLNTIIHCVMFSYYLVAAIYPNWKYKSTFKKTLTQLQLVQFLTFIIIFGKILLWPTCNYPRYIGFLTVTQNIFLLFLFSDFYYKAYVKKSKTK